MIDVRGWRVKKDVQTSNYPYKKLKAAYERLAHLSNYINKSELQVYEKIKKTKTVKFTIWCTDRVHEKLISSSIADFFYLSSKHGGGIQREISQGQTAWQTFRY